MPEDTKKREEYAPITQELREYIERHPTMMHAVGLTDLCDNIDALHKSLEDKFIVLRDFCEHVKQIAHARKDVTLWGTDYMAMPLDADGVPVHIGDMMDTSAFGTVEVEGFIHSAIAFYNYNEDQQARLCTSPAKLCHHHKPTVADLLREFYVLAVRGKEAHAEDVDEDVLAEYAAKLRLAGDADE